MRPPQQDWFLNLAQFAKLLLQAQIRRAKGRDIQRADQSCGFAEMAMIWQGVVWGDPVIGYRGTIVV